MSNSEEIALLFEVSFVRRFFSRPRYTDFAFSFGLLFTNAQTGYTKRHRYFLNMAFNLYGYSLLAIDRRTFVQRQ